MIISLVTPAPPRSRVGNRTTALRWARILRALGHTVRISVNHDARRSDAMIALHAWRSAEAIDNFKARYPERPLILALTGTDLYRFIHTHPDTTLYSIRLADRLVVLHELAYQALPSSTHPKIHVIYQSAIALGQRHSHNTRQFNVCVVAHLREEKDPLRAAYAARELPRESRIRVLHYGKAYDEHWANKARVEMQRNPRYHWFDQVPHWQVRRSYARCQCMILSSIMEGGANVVSEAVVAELPLLCSRIPGSVGLLGTDYEGYFEVQDTEGLRDLLREVESKPNSLTQLETQCRSRAQLFTPEEEMRRWKILLHGLGG